MIPPCDPAGAAAGLKELMLGPPLLTLAVAESLTCGLVQARVGAISGASAFFLGGLTAYDPAVKAHLLGVDPDEAARANGVSERIAAQMARGACALFGARLAVATTGYAEPSAERGVGDPFAWWAVAFPADDGSLATETGRMAWPGASREEAREAGASAALAALVARLRILQAG